jgi:hypothetical protein
MKSLQTVARVGAAWCAPVVIAACSTPALSVDRGADAAADVVTNAPPAWVMAPDALTLGQGQHRVLTVAIADPEGDAVVHSVTAPPGVSLTVDGVGAATQWSLYADYTVEGPQAVSIASTDARGARTTHALALTVTPLRWNPRISWTSAGPAAREHGALVLDATRRQLFLLGGSGYAPQGTPLSDAWQYDLTTGAWRAATVDGDMPAAAGSRRVVLMPDGLTAYLFGGYGAANAQSNDLFRVTFRDGGATVRRIEQRNPPPARSLHAFAYDPVSHRFVVFGGAGRAAPLGDTWTMTLDADLATWTELPTTDGPTARYGLFAGMDAERGRLIVFGGAQGFNPLSPAPDTWALDVRSEPPAWHQLATGDEPGSTLGRRNGVAVWDPTGPRLWIFGGTADARTTEPGLWVFDAFPGAERWTMVERTGGPPLRSSAFGLYDAPRNRVVFGFGNAAGVYQDLASFGY